VGAVLWATVVAVVFYPLHKTHPRPSAPVGQWGRGHLAGHGDPDGVVPTLLVGFLLTSEARNLLGQVDLRGVEVSSVIAKVRGWLPGPLANFLDTNGWFNPQRSSSVSGAPMPGCAR
jgi:hypothetical protein